MRTKNSHLFDPDITMVNTCDIISKNRHLELGDLSKFTAWLGRHPLKQIMKTNMDLKLQ